MKDNPWVPLLAYVTVHRESKEIPVVALVVAKNGPKLKEVKDADTAKLAVGR